MSESKLQVPDVGARELESVLERVLSELDKISDEIQKSRSHLQQLTRLAQTRVALAKSLVSALPASNATAAAAGLAKALRGNILDSRISPAHEYVRSLVATKKHGHIRPSELIKTPEFQQIGLDPKSLYNTLNYMARRGELRKVSRGRYLVKCTGIGVETAHEFDCDEKDQTD